MLLVRLTRGGTVETEAPLDQADLRVGRASDNEIPLKDPEKTLSRHHAELRREGDQWVYLDLNSANGSWLGERKITRLELVPGVAITLGDYQLTLARVDGPQDAAAADATQILRRDTETLRPVAAARKPDQTERRPAASPAVVGGAVAMGPAAVKPAASAGPTTIRRIIIYGSIVVFGAFGVMVALLLRPSSEAPAPEPAPAAVAPAATTPAPPPPAVAVAPTPVNTTPSAPVVAEKAPAPPPLPNPAPPAPAPPVARPVRDADPDAATIPARPGESAAALQQRRGDIRRRYALALERLAARQFADAHDLLAALSREVPRFRDLNARIAESDDGLRQQAAENFKAAATLEESAQWTEALTAYERLKPLAASLPNLTEAIDRTSKKMHEAGVDALTRARQFDSRGRVPEAIAWYQRAVNWLPPDHPGLETARQRLAALVNRP